MRPRFLYASLVTLFLSVNYVQAHPPTGIVINSQGAIFFTDLETVWKLEPNGKLVKLRSGVSGRHVHELALDKDGNLLGADLSYEGQKWISDVWMITPDNRLSYLMEPTSQPIKGLSIHRDSRGNSYFVEQDNHAKQQTLLLRRTPGGAVTTLAGGAYGNRDGKGGDACFGSVGGLFIAPDDSIYLTDGTSVRKVTPDGTVKTVASNLTRRTIDDIAPLFGKNDGILTGLTVDKQNNIYLADAGNQRLLKIGPDGVVVVIYRGDGSYYPNGVTVSAAGYLYVLEVGFKPPATWLPARVRQVNAEGESKIIAVSGSENQSDINETNVIATKRQMLSSVLMNYQKGIFFLILLVTVVTASTLVRRAGRKCRD